MIALAWRNVLRNRRRTALTAVSVGFGLAAVLFGQSVIEAVQVQLVEKSTGVFTGHIQIQAAGNRNLKFPDKLFSGAAQVEARLASFPEVAAWGGRLHMTGMVSAPKDSAGVLICGVEPGREAKVTAMSTYLSEGAYLPRADSVYLGERLARQLGLKAGGEVVLLAAAVDGSMGAERFRLDGIFRSGSATFDGQIVYVPLASLQRMLAAEGRINNLVVRLKDPELAGEVRGRLGPRLAGLPVKALSWEEIDHEIVGIRRYQDALLAVVLAVVFGIVALGVVDTMMMSMFERVREFGLLMALGARPGFVVRLILAESFLLCLLGAALGLAGGAALILHYGRSGLELPIKDAIGYFIPFDPVLRLRFSWGKHLAALAGVLLTGAVGGLVPALKASRMRPTESLRHL
ncbi:MAG: FtsX-like permease family protein [Elusimicrobiota bacterium]|jgi:ABC-type lipoprotein release transport system permease subunit